MKKTIKIKPLLVYIFLLCTTLSCTIDNYEKPGLALTGKIVDSQSSELVESGGVNAGTVVRLFEGTSAQPLNYSTLPNGTFANSQVFSGQYTYTAEGPFTLVSKDKVNLVMDKNTDIEIKVIPNVRVKTSLTTASGSTATVKLVYEKMSTEQPLAQLGITWSTSPNPNMLVFPGGNTILEAVTAQTPAQGEKTFTLTNLKPNKTYYVRGAARTTNPGNYYNYTPQFEVKTN